MLSKTFKGFVLASLLAALSMSGSLYGQILNGNIIGNVTDPDGAVVVGATVVLRSELTAVERTLTTESDGNYLFSTIPPAGYTVEVEMAGFNRFINTGVVVGAGRTVRVDVQLEVGDIATEISVTAEAAVIVTETADVSTVRAGKYWTRNPSAQNTGVTFGQPTVSQAGGYFGYHGTREGSAHMSMDGAELDAYRQYLSSYAVDEVKVTHTVAPANFQTPVNIQIVSKRGTNSYHGRIEGMMRNNVLNANNPRNHTRPVGTGTWEAGFVLNGPAWIPKIYDGRNSSYWMLTYITFKNNAGDRQVSQLHPDAAWRTGDLSSFGTQLVDPLTGMDFPGNIIPADRIHPIAVKLNTYLRDPVPGTNRVPGIWTYLAAGGRRINYRFDHKVTETFEVLTSYAEHSQQWDGAGGFNDRSVYDWAGPFHQSCCAKTFALGTTNTLSPTLVNEFRIGFYNCASCNVYRNYTRGGNPADTVAWAEARLKDLGLTGITAPDSGEASSGPNFQIAGFTPFNGWGTNLTRTYQWTVSDSLSWYKGKHSVQAGFEIRRPTDESNRVWSTNWGTQTFSGAFTGNPYADFLLGMPTTMAKGNLRPIIVKQAHSIGLFITDTFRVLPNLTLSYGVRYDVSSPTTDELGLHYTYDPSRNAIVVPDDFAMGFIDPLWVLDRNPVITADQAGLPKGLWRTDKDNIQPRFGMAWRPNFDDKLVIRAGYGMYTIMQRLTRLDFVETGGPFALSYTFDNVDSSSGRAQPTFMWPVGLPDAAALGAPPIPSLSFVNPDSVWPYTQQANISIENEVGGQRARVSYIWSKETQMFYRRDINLPMPQAGVAWSNDRRLVNNYNSINETHNGGGATYHAFEAVIYPRNVFGFSGEIGMAWSKQMTDVVEVRFNSNRGNANENPHCRRCDRAESSAVAPFRTVNYVHWQVPYGRGQRFGSGISGVMNQILGGWELSTQTNILSGQGVSTRFTGPDPSGLGKRGGRPDLVGTWKSWVKPDGSDDDWYNAGAFAVPGDNIGRFGNAGRNILRAPNVFSMALGLFKNFPIGENMNILFSSQINNPFNYASWGYSPNQPTFNINSPTATRLPGLRAGMRSARFNLAFEF